MHNDLLAYTEGDDRFDAFIVRPATPPPWPAVLICHAWAGRGELEEDRARRLAELGYLAAAIDLYGVGRRGSDRDSCAALMSTLTNDPPLLRRRLTAAYQAVRTLDEVDPDRMGAIGFCFGGLCALVGARMGLRLRGVVSFHGLLKIGEPLDAKVHARVLVLHGQDDPMVSAADIATFAEHMQRQHVDWQLHAYPKVMHAFTNPRANDPAFGTVYDAEADRRSWQTMASFFAEVLGDASSQADSASQELAELLNTGLTGNADTPEDIAALLGEMQALDDDDDDDDDADDDDVTLDEPAPDPVSDDAENEALAAEYAALDDVAGAGPDDTAGAGPDEDDPDVCREGLWSDPERRSAGGRHVTYRLHATHHRSAPITAQFTGECQCVRVCLPQRRPARGMYIGTFIGRVEADDHLLFSVEEVSEAYAQRHGSHPKVARVELITGARFMGRRFSPVSCFLAYSEHDATKPCFYILEGGSASGNPEALYVAQNMSARIHEQSGFRFTPLACPQNWYTGRLTLDKKGHPKLLQMSSAQDKDGGHEYFELSVRYAVEKKQRRVISPFGLQVEAAFRVLAIAEQVGCELGKGRGGGLQKVVGPFADNSKRWDITPQGTATDAERERYCGCPKPR